MEKQRLVCAVSIIFSVKSRLWTSRAFYLADICFILFESWINSIGLKKNLPRRRFSNWNEEKLCNFYLSTLLWYLYRPVNFTLLSFFKGTNRALIASKRTCRYFCGRYVALARLRTSEEVKTIREGIWCLVGLMRLYLMWGKYDLLCWNIDAIYKDWLKCRS